MNIDQAPETLGLVLAGGLARRMGGGDKIMLRVGGATILERVLHRFQPQCAALVLNANGDPTRFRHTGLPVVADDISNFAGPLAGILAGLDWVSSHAPQIEWIASVPSDAPFLPRDLVVRLHNVRLATGKPLVCARSGGRKHPVVGLWPVNLRADLRHALLAEDVHKIETWTARHGFATAEWLDQPVDPFFNVNTPDDEVAAEAITHQYPEA